MYDDLEPLEATVDVLLRATQDVVADERDRGQVLDSKCAQITGFMGVILALDATLAGTVLAEPLTPTYTDLLSALFALGVATLVVGAVAAIKGAIIPQKSFAFDRDQFASFADGEIALSETVAVKQTLIRSYAWAVGEETKRNSRKADALEVASWALGIGLCLVAVQVGTLGLGSITGDMSDTPPKPQAPRPTPPAVLKPTIIKKGGDEADKEKRGS